MKAIVVLAALALSSAAWAKDLYMTVRRDYSPAEPAIIELNYVASSPVVFRLYKPVDMKEFIASQIDLRRSWRKPKVEINTARYLLRGLNESALDLDWLRVAMNRELRLGLKKEYGGGQWQRPGTPLVEGPKTMVLGPEKFELVQELAVNPDDTDAHTLFDVPGFNWWFPSRGALRTKQIELHRLTPGFYLVQALQGNLEGQVVVVVNDLVAELQQTEGAALVRAADRDGRPAAGAAVEVRNLQGKWIAQANTGPDGVAELSRLTDKELVVVVRHKESIAIIDSDFYATTAAFPDAYLYTDRPMYKPGNKVHFRGVLREPANGVSRLMASFSGKGQAAVSVIDAADGTVVQEQSFPVSAFGTFTGEMTLPSGSSSGVYRVAAAVAGAAHTGEFRVNQYVKPLIFVKIDSKQETLKAGATLEARLSVQRYAGGVPGGVPGGATAMAHLYRVRSESPQWVDDAGMGETGSATTYGWDKAEAVNVSVPIPILDSEDISFDGVGRASLTMKLPADLPGDPSFNYKFVLSVAVRDADGNAAASSKSFLDRKSEVDAQVRMTAVLTGPDNPAKLEVRAVTPSGKPYGKTAGEVGWYYEPYKQPVIVLPRVPFETDANGRWSVAVPSDKPGKLTARVTLWDKQKHPATGEAWIVVMPREAGAGVVAVEEATFLTRRSYFYPGETAKALVLLPEGWGEGGKNAGRLYVTVAGRGIHEQRVQKVDGLSAWLTQPIKGEYGTAVYLIVSYPSPKQGWVERTLTYNIPPKDKAMKVEVKPLAELAPPGTDQTVALRVLDSDAKPVRAELSVSVVDKALLALQPEFRPALVQFFYPLQRLNLMTFFSTQFQSYGYGEPLAGLFRPNHWFASAKPEEEKLKEDDTAFWKGDVVTDETGAAKVTFRLPANQTIWNVSAVAVDMDGRFGEGTGEFRASMPVSIALAYPDFLRTGDSAYLRVVVGNQDPGKSHEVKAALTAPSLEIEKKADIAGALKPKQELRESRVVKLASRGLASLDLKTSLEYGDKKVQFDHKMRALPDTAQYPESIDLEGAGGKLTLGAKESASDARVVVTSGFAGAVLPALQWSLAYPFGCVEQVTSTTVPSLVMKSVIEMANPRETASSEAGWMDRLKRGFFSAVGKVKAMVGTGPYQLTPDQKKALDDATTFADAGLQRLKSFQNADGSFNWFPGGGEGNRAMTLLVLMTLVSQDSTAVIEKIDFRKAMSWLGEEPMETGSPQAFIVSYVGARLYKLGLSPDSPASNESKLRFQAETVAKRGTVFERALVLLAIRESGLAGRPGFDELTKPLLADLKKEIDGLGDPKSLKLTAWTPADVWEEYPGRFPSALALAGRALHEYGAIDEAGTRKLAAALLVFFNGAHFGSTFETAQALIHSTWIVADEIAKGRGAKEPPVTVDGKRVAGVKATPLIGGWSLALPAGSFKPGDSRVALEGGAKDFQAARLRIVKEAPLDGLSPVEQGWSIRKTYALIDEKTGQLSELGDRPKVKVGDLVYTTITFQKRADSRIPWGSSYYVLTDLVPAGMSFVEEDKVYEAAPYQLDFRSSRYKQREVSADRVRWYYAFDHGWMDRGWSVSYVLRASYAGDFVTGMARIESFYDEMLYSQSGSGRMAIEPLAAR